jgi:hypothetical protein
MRRLICVTALTVGLCLAGTTTAQPRPGGPDRGRGDGPDVKKLEAELEKLSAQLKELDAGATTGPARGSAAVAVSAQRVAAPLIGSRPVVRVGRAAGRGPGARAGDAGQELAAHPTLAGGWTGSSTSWSGSKRTWRPRGDSAHATYRLALERVARVRDSSIAR